MPFLFLYISVCYYYFKTWLSSHFVKCGISSRKWFCGNWPVFSQFYWSEPCCCLRCKFFPICKPTNTWNIKNNSTSQVAVVTHRILASLIQRRMKAPWMQKKKSSDKNPASVSIWQRLKPTYWVKVYYLTNTVKCLVKFTIYMQNEQKSLAYLLSVYENMLT